MVSDASQKPDESKSEGRGMRLAASSTLIVFSVILVGRLLGVARDLVIAPLFGAGADVDALVAARTVPEIALHALAFGIVTALVPAIAQAGRGGALDPQGWRAISVVINWIVVFLFGLTVVGIVFPEPILKIVAPGLDQARQTQAAQLLRIMMPVVLFATCGGVLGAFLHYRRKFGLPSARAAVTNVSIIVISILGWRVLGVASVAVGWLLGAILQFVLLVPFSKTVFRDHKLVFDPRTEGAGRLARSVLPICFSNLLLFVRYILERRFGSFLQVGALSHLNYALRIASAPLLIFANAVSTVYLTVLSRSWAKQDRERVESALREAVRLYLFGITPFVVVFLVVPDSLVALLLERGAFTAHDTAVTAGLLKIYVVTLIAGGLTNVFAQFFFAIRETATPNLALVVAAVAQIAVTLHLIGSHGASAVVWGTGVGTVVSAGLMFIRIGQKMGLRSALLMVRDFAEYVTSGLVMLAVFVFSHRLVEAADGTLSGVTDLIFILAAGGSAYLLSHKAFGGAEMKALFQLVRRGDG